MPDIDCHENARIAKANLIHLMKQAKYWKAALEERKWKAYRRVIDQPIPKTAAAMRKDTQLLY